MADQNVRDILDRMLERRDKVKKELDALESLIVIYRGLANEQTSESSAVGDDLFGGDGQLKLSLQRSPRAVQAAVIARCIDAARKMILAERKPMKRGELVRRLEAEGYNLPGTDKNKVFGTNLWRSGKFRMIEGRGYWPKDVSLPRD